MLKTAIYVNDYLLLLDLIAKIEQEFPLIEYTIFGDQEFAESLENQAEEYIETDLSLLKDIELLIMLAKPKNSENAIKDYDGTIIDITGYTFSPDAKVLKLYEPVRKILRNITVPISDVSVVVSLPVCIYGKHGVEDLMHQTRNIFTFDEIESKIFHNRIAFNKYYNPNIEDLPIGKTIDDFTFLGGDISVRISPLSTVFEMDIFSKDVFGLKNNEGYFPIENFFTASDISERSDIAVIPIRNGFTYIGDYIRVLIEDIIKQMKEVI